MVAISGAEAAQARTTPVAVPRRRRKTNWGNVVCYVVLSGWMVFTLFPVARLLMSSVKEPADVFARNRGNGLMPVPAVVSVTVSSSVGIVRPSTTS